ncbi:uncharacterized protein LOC141700974 [Apium graveolens]|uniref:uncharacterized protein LOC141700974 n=1 Tax=Apium graveolens TaxID=4045 RepID=UPI003D7B861C
MEPPRSIKDVQKLTGRIAALGKFISKSGDKCLPFFKTLKKVKDFEWTAESQEAFEQLKKYMTEAPLLAKPSLEDTLYLYLAVFEQVVSVVLVKEEQKLQKPVYYVSKLDFSTTNNEAEYEALVGGLGLARAVRANNLKVCGDSRLVVAQVNGEFEAKDDTMAKYLRVVKGILTQFDEYTGWCGKLFDRPDQDPLKNWVAPRRCLGGTQAVVRALRYSLIEGLLYKRSFVIPYLKCLRSLEAEEEIKESHEGIYGQHLGGRALAHKITQLGFYWPTMLADAKDSVKRCNRCQRHAPIVRQPPEKLTSISTPIPFKMWGMDILGPFPMASGQRKFIVVAIDYFTKWIEAKALAKITTKQITQFFWENANGQAEVANRIILDGLKKRVECFRNTRVDELLPILWAYHTTCKVTTEATPFMLAYGAVAVVPLEITHGSPRIEAYEPETNEKGMRLALDLIDEVRDEANARNAEHQRRASLYYNRRVKESSSNREIWF